MSSKWRIRPSEFLAIDHAVEAYYFDKAVFLFGNALDADLEEHSKSRSTKHPDKPEVTRLKREQRLSKWLEEDGKRQFRDPALEMGR